MSVKQVMSTAANVLEIAGSASGLPYATAAGQILSAIIDVCDNVRVNKKKARAIRDKCVRIQGVLVEEEANLDGTDVLESIHETLNTLDSIKNRMSRVARAKSWEIWKNGEWEKTLDRCEEDLEWAQSKFMSSKSLRSKSQGVAKRVANGGYTRVQERPDLPITFHTLPPTPSTSKIPPRDANNAQKQKLASSTGLVPRLVSVVEIVKREYMKDLKEKRASRMKGLYQYNEVGILEEEQGGESDEDEEDESANREGRRAEKIIEALSGKNHVRQTQTPFMRVTLSTFELPHLQAAGATYQPPETRKLTKSAKTRAAKRRKREGGGQEAGEGDTETGVDASSSRVPAKPPIAPGDVSMDDP
ncbi:hypothetical protein NMY22_g5248 [Coprinellus aureogranulatus]|nr:hypothetical protein NMY22_g5248 [Coprinellus aureogranulatus]